MKRNPLLVFSVLPVWFLVTSCATAEQPEKDDRPIWLVVTTPALAQAIQPLADHRAKDGFKPIISTAPPAQAIQSLPRPPAFILLVGDNEPGREDQPWFLPAERVQKYRWQSSQDNEFASDVVLTDLDGDSLPDIPIGRIPARTAEQVRRLVSKIIAFEQTPPTLNDLRLPAWAGAAGFDPMLDRMASVLLLQVVRTKLPQWVTPWIISADPTSPFCGWPADQPAQFTQQLKTGGALAVLIGHANVQHFYAINFMGRDFWYSAADAIDILANGQPAPPLVMICCLAGNFASDKQCLAESMLEMPAGPTAVIAATAESHPLTNYFSSVSLIQALDGSERRLGTLWLKAQKESVQTRDLIIESMLSHVEGKLDVKIDLTRLRRDQMLMYVLLGDPALKLKLPEKLHGTIKRHEDGWHWEIHKPQDAIELRVEFRPAQQQLPVVTGDLQIDTARNNFQSANHALEFVPLSQLRSGQEWKGMVNSEGTLRLVAIGPEKIYVVALNLTNTATKH